MSDPTRAVTIAKLQVVLQRSLIEMRNLALRGALEQVYDLADTVEFLPSLVLRWDDEQANLVRLALDQYESKYSNSSGRYTGILNMEEQEFNQMYRPEQYCWDAEDA